ncbi:MAG: chitobiase/beta-hexosaminidase C-terminal domain-containing protein, partial [Steroidobacteraceae bacterium]
MRIALVLLAALGISAARIASAQVSVTTYQNDIGRTGQNLSETILTTSNVNAATFGKLFSQTVAGAVSAQPLVLAGPITTLGTPHPNGLVLVATRSDWVYAFDAGSNVGANAAPAWKASLLDAPHGAAAGAQNYGGLGVTSTPVIDPVAGIMYVVSVSLENNVPVYRLHALDVTTGGEKVPPMVILGSVPGTAGDAVGGELTFTPAFEKQNTALLLLNGVVYFGFGSRTEANQEYWHGWIFGYTITDNALTQTGVFCTSPDGNRGGVWMYGAGLAADQLDPVNAPYGRMFVATGNGDFTGAVPYTTSMDFGDSVLNLDLTNGSPTVTDDFTPSVQAILATHDGDQGSGGALVLPAQTTGAYPNLLVQTGKTGTLYLLDRDNLGGYNASGDQVVQFLPDAVGNSGPLASTGAWSAPAYWNGNVYYWGVYDYLKSFTLANGSLSTTPTTSTELGGYPGVTPTISANGATEGIVWAVNVAGSSTLLLAHDASNVATTLYSSATNATRDSIGGVLNPHAVPTVANGMVYVATTNILDFYGLLSGTQTSTPAFTPGSSTFTTSVSVTITDSSPDAAIYYTTDGTPASASSTPYSGPILVTTTQTINAVAISGTLPISNQASATFKQAATAPPTFSPAAVAYSSAQLVTIADSTPGATIYYTTNGKKPTTKSTQFLSPINVSASETLNAIAQAPGYTVSGVGSAYYAIDSGGSILINEGAGFTSASGLSFVGPVQLVNNGLQLTLAGGGAQDSAAWSNTPVNVQTFTTDFYFSEASSVGEGFTFTLQNAPAGLTTVGSAASGGLGYAGIPSSVAVKFDIYDDAGEGIDSTGFYTDGASPTLPSVDMSESPINLHSADIMHAHITYDGTTLTLALIDTVTSGTFTTSTPINIPSVVGSSYAYVGFTAAGFAPGPSGPGATATQTILNWTYVSTSTAPPLTATPTFTPAAGGYPGAQSVTINDAISGAAIYYTTNGTTPTTSSTAYSGPISVSANETLEAIAVATGDSPSLVGTAVYSIATAVPTFTPAHGYY